MCILPSQTNLKRRKSSSSKTLKILNFLEPLIKFRKSLIKDVFGCLCTKTHLFAYQGVREFAEPLIRFFDVASLA